MPNDRLRGKFGARTDGFGAPNRVIVASAWHIDDADEHEVAVLTMVEESPFYRVEYWTAEEDGSLIRPYAVNSYANICQAAAEWSEICGVDCEIA